MEKKRVRSLFWVLSLTLLLGTTGCDYYQIDSPVPHLNEVHPPAPQKAVLPAPPSPGNATGSNHQANKAVSVKTGKNQKPFGGNKDNSKGAPSLVTDDNGATAPKNQDFDRNWPENEQPESGSLPNHTENVEHLDDLDELDEDGVTDDQEEPFEGNPDDGAMDTDDDDSEGLPDEEDDGYGADDEDDFDDDGTATS